MQLWHVGDQGLSEAAGSPVRISFTPTLMPMSRGMQATIYVRLTAGTSADDLREHLQASSFPHFSCAHINAGHGKLCRPSRALFVERSRH